MFLASFAGEVSRVKHRLNLGYLVVMAVVIVLGGGQWASASVAYTGGADLSPSVVASDETPSAVHFSFEGLAAQTEYHAKARLKADSGYSGENWNSETQVWLGQGAAWAKHPIVTTGADGRASGWLHFKSGGATPGHYALQIVVREVAATTNMLPSMEPNLQVIDTTTAGGWIHGTAYDIQGQPLQNAVVMVTDAGGSPVALYPTEPNSIDDGYPDDIGYFRLAAPTGDSFTARVRDPQTLATIGVETSGIEVTTGGTTTIQINATNGDNEGPLVTNVSLSTSTITVDKNTIISAQADDTLTGASPIARAEYFVDTDPGQGQASPVLPADGLFDTVYEELTVTAAAPSQPGRYTIYIRVQDSAGNWGEIASVPLHVWSYILQDPVRMNELRINAETKEVEVSLPSSGVTVSAITDSFLLTGSVFMIVHTRGEHTLTAVGDFSQDAALVWLTNNDSGSRRLLVYDPRGTEN